MNKPAAALLLSLAFFPVTAAFAQNSVCPVPDENKIAVMGSSVALGHLASNAGASFSYYTSFDFNHKGYAFNYATLLNDRFTQGKGANWKMANISIGGNTTPLIMARWKADLLPTCARYVIYGLSLTNEGIQTNAAAYEQFRVNMLKLIQDARDSGMVPLVANNYSNNDFTAAIYAKIKAMDLLIHQWDVPSINILGTLDDGAGHWVAGHFGDALHPNDKGYVEIAAGIVPSLFDALKDKKPRPAKTPTTFVRTTLGRSLYWQPEDRIRSFTVVFDIRTRGTGTVLRYSDSTGIGGLSIDSTGALVYRSSRTTTRITGTAALNDGEWHTVALTHYNANARTQVYVDSLRLGTIALDSIRPATFQLGPGSITDSLDVRNLLFYRAGMTQTEMGAIQTGALLQSSLELYAPLNGNGALTSTSLANLAQSKNTLTTDIVSIRDASRRAHAGQYMLTFANGRGVVRADRMPTSVRVYDLAGKRIGNAEVRGNVIDWNSGSVKSGVYLMELNALGAKDFVKVSL